MAAGTSAFPDLDVALTVSRVEVVSNVEIETIKTALCWLFDQAQNSRKAVEASDVSATQTQIDDLNKLVQEQSTRVTALQEQQVFLPRDDVNYAAPANRAIYGLRPRHVLLPALGCCRSCQGPRCPCLPRIDKGCFVMALQDKLLQSSQEAQQALKPSQELPDALSKLQEGQGSSIGTVLDIADTSIISRCNATS